MKGIKQKIIEKIKDRRLIRASFNSLCMHLRSHRLARQFRLYESGKLREEQMYCHVRRNKLTNKLNNEFRKEIKKLKQEIEENFLSLPHSHPKIIWFCWFQGMESAPDIVKTCYRSLMNNVGDEYSINIITEQNFKDYCDFPEYILKKYKQGKISTTHFSDLLRLELLTRHGGTWMDATIFCTGKIPDFMLDSDFFLPQTVLWETQALSYRIDNFLITACQNQKILLMAQKLLYVYWKKYNICKDYLLTYLFIELSIEQFKEEWLKVIPYPRANMHVLSEKLFAEYNEETFQHIKNVSSVHKLTCKKLNYKLFFIANSAVETYYDFILNNY